MRLIEMAQGQIVSDLSNILKVLQGKANNDGAQSDIPWAAINHMLASRGYPAINKDVMDQVLPDIDPDGNLVHDYNDQGVVLVTNYGTPEVDEPGSALSSGGDSVDSMASHAAKDSLK